MMSIFGFLLPKDRIEAVSTHCLFIGRGLLLFFLMWVLITDPQTDFSYLRSLVPSLNLFSSCSSH